MQWRKERSTLQGLESILLNQTDIGSVSEIIIMMIIFSNNNNLILFLLRFSIMDMLNYAGQYK